MGVDGQTVRQTDRQTETGKQEDRLAKDEIRGGGTDRQRHRQTETQTDRDRRVVGQTGQQGRDKGMGAGGTDRQTDRQTGRDRHAEGRQPNKDEIRGGEWRDRQTETGVM